MTFSKNIFYLLIPFFAISCSTVNTLTISVQRPAEITIPLDIATISVVNNAVDQPADIGHKYFQYKRELGVVEVKADSINSILTGALAQFLDEAQFYSRVSFYPHALRNDQSFLQEKPLEASDVQEICESEGADAVLSLDRFLVLLESDKEHLGGGVETNTLVTRMQAKFSLYTKEGERLMSPLAHTDSLFWQEVVQGDYPLTEPMPSREDALKESAIYMATKMEGSFVPHWEEQNRWFYSGASTQLKQAGLYINSNRWEDALAIWQSLYDTENNSKQKAKLASNIALAYEIGDNLEEALNWINVAQDLLEASQKSNEDKDLLRAMAYKKGLEIRANDFLTLDLQQGK